jgi:hypothetical protein
MRTHKINLAFVAIIFLFFSLACSFKFGNAGGNSNTETSRRKDSANGKIENRKYDTKKEKSADDDSISRTSETAQKLGGYRYQRLDYSLYLIAKNLSKDEMTEIAQNLHEQEPKTILLLVDDDSEAEQFIAYHRQLEDFHQQPGAEKPAAEYPLDWANRHVVGTVNLFLESGERNWYLVEGDSLSDKKISKLE